MDLSALPLDELLALSRDIRVEFEKRDLIPIWHPFVEMNADGNLDVKMVEIHTGQRIPFDIKAFRAGYGAKRT